MFRWKVGQSSKCSGGKELGRMGRQEARGNTSETGDASSSTGDGRGQESGKKHKKSCCWESSGKIINTTLERPVRPAKKISMGRRASLGKTYENQTEANDEVRELNPKN